MAMAYWYTWTMLAKQTVVLSDTLAGEPDGAQFLPLVQQMITSTQESKDFANHASERAIKIISADTGKEAQVFADDVAESLAKSQQAIEDVSDSWTGDSGNPISRS